jgi:hypothetical protein
VTLEAPASLPQFRLGTVISRSFSVLGRNLLTFFVVTIVCVIPLVLVGAALAAILAATFVQAGNVSGTVVVVVFVFAAVFTYLLIQSAISFGTFQAVRGEKARIGACIGRAFVVLPRVFGATIIIGVVMGLIVLVFGYLATVFLGNMFLGGMYTGEASINQGIGGFVGAIAMILLAVVPILFLAVVWWVVVPSIVVEQAGPIGALSRSYRLVSGHRWGVLGLLILVPVANWLVSKVLENLIAVTSSSMAVVSILSILGILASLFFVALGSVMAAVGYYHLRAEKEGFGVDDLAHVFD